MRQVTELESDFVQDNKSIFALSALWQMLGDFLREHESGDDRIAALHRVQVSLGRDGAQFKFYKPRVISDHFAARPILQLDATGTETSLKAFYGEHAARFKVTEVSALPRPRCCKSNRTQPKNLERRGQIRVSRRGSATSASPTTTPP